MNLGLVYPCLLGARMLGSTVFPWLLTGPSSLRTEDCLVYTFIVMGVAFSIVAYDYQVSMCCILDRYKYYASNLIIVQPAYKLMFICEMQEIGVLVSIFYVFHAGVGLIIPSLARLRTMYAEIMPSQFILF